MDTLTQSRRQRYTQPLVPFRWLVSLFNGLMLFSRTSQSLSGPALYGGVSMLVESGRDDSNGPAATMQCLANSGR